MPAASPALPAHAEPERGEPAPGAARIVTDLLESLLEAATRAPPPVVDLDLSDDDVTFVTVVRDSRSAPQSQEEELARAMLPGGAGVDHGDDDDDVVEIVGVSAPIIVDDDSPALTDPPSPPPAAPPVIDVEDDARVVADPHQDANPPLPLSLHSSDDDVVECFTPARRPPQRPVACNACTAPLRSQASLTISRCKHVLCPSCALRSIAEIPAATPNPTRKPRGEPNPEQKLPVLTRVQEKADIDSVAVVTLDAGKPNAEKPDAEKTDVEKPDADISDVEIPDVEIPGLGKPDAEKPDAKKRGAANPDAQKPSDENRGAEKSNAGRPAAESPAAERLDALKPIQGNADERWQQSPCSIICASELLTVPVCAVPRCRAPLSPEEAEEALAAPEADVAFKDALAAFHVWRKADPDREESNIGDTPHIEFPRYAGEFTAFALPSGSIEGIFNLIYDDMAAACEALWAFELGENGGAGAWICTACGLYDTTVVAASPASESSPDGSDDVDEVEAIPDSGTPSFPSYVHCARARAIGVYEHVKGLSRVWEDEKETEKRKGDAAKRQEEAEKRGEEAANAAETSPMSAIGKRRSTRKRFKSASSIRSAKRRKLSCAKKGKFAKGTGYAGASGAEWTGASEELLAETAKRDAEATFWLIRLRCFLLRSGNSEPASWPGFMRSLLRECQLIPLLAKILINESIMDVLGRIPLFYSALRVVQALTEVPSLRLLVTEPSDGDKGRSVAELVESLSRQAAFLTTGAGPEGLSESTSFFVKQIRKCIRVINRHNLLQVVKNRSVAFSPVDLDDTDNKSLEQEDMEVARGNLDESTTPAGTVGLPAQRTVSFDADKTSYLEQMRGHQFKAVPGLALSSTFYQEAMRSEMHGAPLGRRQRRIASEVASLFSSLPLSWSSTILLRVDEDRYDFLRACIFGPEDTPYDSGAFVFDIYLPQTYPDVPPKFRLLTTGGGKVRFNPNLYSNGKVCLSLLGTWSGPSWTSTSTILQVLVSIQSLILVPDPYFNEPGFERNLGTEAGKRASAHYNARARLDTALYAIHSNIRHPPPELATGIVAHFRLKRRYLGHNLRNWFPNATKKDSNEVPSNGAPPMTQGNFHPFTVSVDPLGGLAAAEMSQLVGGATVSSAGALSLAFSSFGTGRHFRSPEMSHANLESIIADLDALAQ